MTIQKRIGVALGAVTVVGILAGVAQAVAWSLLAPQQRWIVYPDGTFLSLPMESAHRYTAIGLFVLMSTVIGIVLAVAAWQIRFARGPRMILALVAGTALGSLIALLLGEALIGGVIPEVVAQTPPAEATMVSMIPGLSWVSMIVAPLAALVPYTILVAWHSDPDLARPPGPQTPPAGVDAITAPIPVVVAQPGAARPGSAHSVTGAQLRGYRGDGTPRTDP